MQIINVETPGSSYIAKTIDTPDWAEVLRSTTVSYTPLITDWT